MNCNNPEMKNLPVISNQTTDLREEMVKIKLGELLDFIASVGKRAEISRNIANNTEFTIEVSGYQDAGEVFLIDFFIDNDKPGLAREFATRVTERMLVDEDDPCIKCDTTFCCMYRSENRDPKYACARRLQYLVKKQEEKTRSVMKPEHDGEGTSICPVCRVPLESRGATGTITIHNTPVETEASYLICPVCKKVFEDD